MVQLQSGTDNSDRVQATDKTLQYLLNNMVDMINLGESSDKGVTSANKLPLLFDLPLQIKKM
jgi:hypothetical protein